MAKAKSIVEQLLGMLSPEEQAKLKAAPEFANIQKDDNLRVELHTIYDGGDDDTTSTTTATTTTATTAPAATATATTTATPGAGESVVDQLKALNASLDTRFKNLSEELAKKFVPVDKVDQFRTEILTTAMKESLNVLRIGASHQAEFGEPLNEEAFRKFVLDNKQAGVTYPDLTKAHDAWVADKRAEKKIKDGIADGLKAKKSGAEVPGQTQATSLSPAQQIIATAKAKAAGGDGKSNAMAAAEKMASLRRAREEGEAGTVQ